MSRLRRRVGVERDRSLSRLEFEAVIRRATELAASEPEDDGPDLTEAELFRIAREVGLPEKQVRTALAEIRAAPEAEGPLGALLGPEVVRAARVVPGPRSSVVTNLDEFLVGGQLLQAVRRSRSLLQYRPAVDWASSVARAASATGKRYYVAASKRVEVRLEEVESERCFVEIEVEPGTRDGSFLGVLLGGPAAGLGSGIGVGLGLATVAPLVLAVAGGLVTAGAVGWLVVWLVARKHRKELVAVRSEVEGILDQLEAGETLEPPPPAWRRWVRRHFHGVARDLGGRETEPDDSSLELDDAVSGG